MVIYVLVNTNNIVKSYGIPISEEHVPIENGVEVDADLDIDSVQIVDNYKLCDGKLVELTDEEKLKPLPEEPNKMEVLEKQLKQQEEAIGLIAIQVAKNTLLQNGGMRI